MPELIHAASHAHLSSGSVLTAQPLWQQSWASRRSSIHRPTTPPAFLLSTMKSDSFWLIYRAKYHSAADTKELFDTLDVPVAMLGPYR